MIRVFGLTLGLLFVSCSIAAPLTPGNLLVTAGGRIIFEYSRSGAKLQEISIPKPIGQGSDDFGRDLIFDDGGALRVYDGTFTAGISSLVGSEWTHWHLPGLSSSYTEWKGKLTTFSNFLFVTDDRNLDGDPIGVVRIDMATKQWRRFAAPAYPRDNGIDLCARPNGELYILMGDTNPGGRWIDVYNAITLSFKRKIDLEPLIRNGIARNGFIGIEVDRSGVIYLLGNEIYKLNGAGQLIDHKPFTYDIGAQDLDLSDDGLIMVTQFDGSVSLMNSATLDELDHFQTTGYYSSRSFGAFIPYPPANDFSLTSARASVAGENSCRFTARRGHESDTMPFKVQIDDTSSFVDTPATITIPAGKRDTSFFAVTRAVNYDLAVVVRARNGTVTRSCSLLLKALVPSALAFDLQPVPGGSVTNCRVALNGIAGSAGRTLSISDDSASCVTPSQTTVPTGAASHTFAISTLPVSTTKLVTVRARTSAGEKTALLRIVP